MLSIDETKNKLSEIIKYVQEAVISNPLKRGELPQRLSFKPVTVKGKDAWQMSYLDNNKAMHINFDGGNEALFARVLEEMAKGYKQCNLIGDTNATVLMNKKRECTVTGVKANSACKCEKMHNKTKNYILKPKEPVDWLYSLGITDKNGRVHNNMQKKFRQINRFVEMLSDVEKYVPENSVIIDMGCGKSYLTFATYHYFNIIKNKNITIKGYDLKEDVVSNCNLLAQKFGFTGLEFFCQDIAGIGNTDNKIAMIITLHACDTATDYAIYHGIRWGCRVIMNVPCCQHELFKQIKNDDMEIMLRHGIIKERFSALLTDSIRAEILRLCGYRAEVMEFIDMEHTPKNIMIRSVYTGRKCSKEEIRSLERLIEQYNIRPTLFELLKNRICKLED